MRAKPEEVDDDEDPEEEERSWFPTDVKAVGWTLVLVCQYMALFFLVIGILRLLAYFYEACCHVAPLMRFMLMNCSQVVPLVDGRPTGFLGTGSQSAPTSPSSSSALPSSPSLWRSTRASRRRPTSRWRARCSW